MSIPFNSFSRQMDKSNISTIFINNGCPFFGHFQGSTPLFLARIVEYSFAWNIVAIVDHYWDFSQFFENVHCNSSCRQFFIKIRNWIWNFIFWKNKVAPWFKTYDSLYVVISQGCEPTLSATVRVSNQYTRARYEYNCRFNGKRNY